MASTRPSEVSDDQIVVAPCSGVDRVEQAQLYAACFKKPLPERGLSWRYDDVPFGPSVSLVARPPNGTAISGYACSPRRAVAAGAESSLALVGETGDVMTHPEWRKRGFFSRLDRAALEAARQRGWALAFGLPNRRSAHIFVELGWERIGSVRSWTCVLRADAAARDVRAREGRIAGWTTPFAAWKAARARRALEAARSAFRVASVEHFDERAEQLSRAVEPRFSFMLRRDARYLNWRFLQAPSRLHRAWGMYEGEQLAGYVVVQLPRDGARLGHLVDVLGRNERAVAAAIGVGLAELERAGASVVQATAIDGSWWSTHLRGVGFVPPRSDNHLSVILHALDAAHPLVAAARDCTHWYFTDGDRDDETVG